MIGKNLKQPFLPKSQNIEMNPLPPLNDHPPNYGPQMKSLQLPMNPNTSQITPMAQNSIFTEDEYFNMTYDKSYPCYEDTMQYFSTFLGHCRRFCICLCVPSPNVEIPQGYCGLKLRFGRYIETVGPGLQFMTPFTERIIKVDLQTQTLDLMKQNIIMKDNITATVDSAVNYRIINPRYACFRLQNVVESVKSLIYSALRTVCGTYKLNEIQEKKQELTKQLLKYIGEKVKEWGIVVEQIFITDVILSQDLQNTLSCVAAMQRAAISKLISAKADVESAKIMKEAADTLSSEAAMQIRYLKTISHVADSKTTCKLVFMPFVQ